MPITDPVYRPILTHSAKDRRCTQSLTRCSWLVKSERCVVVKVYLCFQVYTVVDEMFLAGEIRETSQTKVLKQLLMLNSLE
uniref:AP complex mu/sigma subunit domain-containing protein n=1 Tax=Timema genevievae TaxID=629358 RepID=A0A7R9PIN2_TIMGE|nr:unnamed protein product [Timema genevievae]